MSLNGLCLVHQVLVLHLLELEVFLFDRLLLVRLRLTSGGGKHKALAHISDIVVVELLRVVLLEMGTSLRRSDESHALLLQVLRLVNQRIVQAFLVNRLAQNLLHVHRATHLLLCIDRARTLLP